MLCVGIDPDLHDVAIACWTENGPGDAAVVHVPKIKGRTGTVAVLWMVRALEAYGIDFRGAQGIAVEAQELKRSGNSIHKRPEDIVILGNVAGAVLMLAAQAKHAMTCFPKPSEWKGSIPKEVMQARLYTDLGWGYQMASNYALPLKAPPAYTNVSRGQWKHVGDALLLARWCYNQIRK